MNRVLKLLKKELREQKNWLRSEKIYFKGYEKDINAIRSFKKSEQYIKELERAITLLK